MFVFFFFFKQKTAYELRISDGSSDVCSSDLDAGFIGLAWYDSGARSMYTRDKPIKTVADVRGLKIRVQQSDLSVAMVEALGANATPMAMGEAIGRASCRERVCQYG